MWDLRTGSTNDSAGSMADKAVVQRHSPEGAQQRTFYNLSFLGEVRPVAEGQHSTELLSVQLLSIRLKATDQVTYEFGHYPVPTRGFSPSFTR